MCRLTFGPALQCHSWLSFYWLRPRNWHFFWHEILKSNIKDSWNFKQGRLWHCSSWCTFLVRSSFAVAPQPLLSRCSCWGREELALLWLAEPCAGTRPLPVSLSPGRMTISRHFPPNSKVCSVRDSTLFLSVAISEWQNHRTVMAGRNLWRSSLPIPVRRQGHLECLQRWRLRDLPE